MPKPAATGRSQSVAERPSPVTVGLPLVAALADWRAYLDGEVQRRRKSPATRNGYTIAVERFVAFAREAGMPPTAEGIRREHIEAWLAALAHRKPATVDTYRRALSRFFSWLVEDDVLEASPAANVRAIPIPDTPPPVLGDEQLAALLAACRGRGFEDRRDSALLWLLLCGLRRGELAGLEVADVDRGLGVVTVTGKGSRTRTVPFLAPEVGDALRRYERARATHPRAALAAYWLGGKGRLTGDGIRQALERRARRAGLEGIHAHLFRHTTAHRWLAAGGTEGDLMSIAGWRSSAMLRRYGASAASERARLAAQRVDVWGDLS